jgi:putative transposase
MALARRSIKQRFQPTPQVLSVMECLRQMTNHCMRFGMEFESVNHRTPSMKKLSLLSYAELRERYGGYSQYVLCAISKAAGILSARRKSIRRGFPTNTPYLSRPMLVSCYGFKVGNDGNLIIHVDAETLESIPLNSHTNTILSEDSMLRVRSFTLTKNSISLCLSKDVKEIMEGEIAGVVGVDRNLGNLTVGNGQMVRYYDMTNIVEIAENTTNIVRSFKRVDMKIRQKIASKYGTRRRDRTKQFLNLVSKNVGQGCQGQ